MAASPLVEITATFQGVRWKGEENPEGRISALLTCQQIVDGEAGGDIGLWLTLDPEELLPIDPEANSSPLRLIRGCNYRFFGRHKEAEFRGKKEKQFQANSYGPAEQHSRESVVRYLEAMGAGYGFGARRASILYDKFGPQAVKVLRLQPEVADAAIRAGGLSVDLTKLKIIAGRLAEHAATEDSLLELNGLLRGKGFPRNLPQELIRSKRAAAAHFVKTNPFGLLIEGFRGCGFKKCDKLYTSLGLDPAALKRQMLCAWHAMKADRSGSTWFPLPFAENAIKQNIGGAEVKIKEAIELGVRSGWMSRVFTEHVNGAPVPASDKERAKMAWIAHGQNARNEQIVAEKLAQLASVDPYWPSPATTLGISEHQREALAKATTSTVAILIGGPGTGKSHTSAAYIKTCIDTFGLENVAVAAPTNKAAVRLTNALREREIKITATSFHRMLGVDSVSGKSWEFRCSEKRPLPYKVLFLDESSMDSLSLLSSVLKACRQGTHLFFIGDTKQLPPIESGAPFRDMLASKVLPFGELVEPQRNAGDIVFACDDIRKGQPFRQSETIDLEKEAPANFKFIAAESPDEQIDKLLRTLIWAKNNNFDPVWDCQVMVATNKASKVSRIPLNKILQEELNKGGKGPKGAKILVGDKVVCEENGMYKAVEEGKVPLFIAKGEFGSVVSSEFAKVFVLFDAREYPVVVPFWNVVNKANDDIENITSVEESEEGDTEDAGAKISLAYACTVHKMQGSECKIALPMVDENKGARGICTEEWFYTAISRGKVLTLPIGKASTAHEFCRRSSLTARKTFLSELIREKFIARTLEALV